MTAEPVARPHPEPVVLDIGGDLGALIVRWDADQIDTPIEISPTGEDGARQHQHILERPLNGRTFYAAVFDKIPEGFYTLWVRDQPQVRAVRVTGGHVTEINWATPPAAAA